MEIYDKNRKNKEVIYILNRYKQYLLMEKGVSKNTFQAYQNDLNKLLDFIDYEGINIYEIESEHLQSFCATLHDVGIHARSQARIISGIKSFFRFLVFSDFTDKDPSELLETPRIGFHLPEVLSLEEVDRIESVIDLSKAEGQRNKAIIETLYSCGLRVSELTNLKISKLYFEDEYIVVIGKGNKQRLVPISQKAIKEIKLYFIDRNQLNIKNNEEDYVFLNRRGRHLSRVMIFNIVKECAMKAEIKKKISPHTFRHTFATHLLEGGANLRVLQEMLGHESIVTTDIYTHLDASRLRSEIIEHHPRNIMARKKNEK